MILPHVFLIDDHDVVLVMLRQLMQDMSIEVSGTAQNGSEAIPLILASAPDLVIMDLSLPDQNGFQIVETLRTQSAKCRFLAFTGTLSAHAMERLHQMRFHGIVSKLSPLHELTQGVKTVLAGRTYCCPLLRSLRTKDIHSANRPANLLTRRETEVLALIGEAKSDHEIAATLELAPSTVQGVRGTLMYKLGLGSTPQLVCFARDKGYTEFASRRSPPPALERS